jgi:hypothetical protein
MPRRTLNILVILLAFILPGCCFFSGLSSEISYRVCAAIGDEGLLSMICDLSGNICCMYLICWPVFAFIGLLFLLIIKGNE